MRNIYLAISFLLPAVVGCSNSVQADYSELGLVQISGTVRLDDQPLAGAVVFFDSEDGTFCYGRTDAEGHYTLKLNSEQTGVIPGEKRVRISTAAKTGEEESTAEGSEEDPDVLASGAAAQEQVPECYHENSKLTVSVIDSDSAVDFSLRSDCSATGRS